MQRLIHHPLQASFQSSFNTWSIQISNRWKLSFIKICKTVARDSIKICSKRMEQFPSESEPGVTSFKGRRQWYESTILEFRFHSLRVRGENSHKNRIATSSSLNSIQYATAKASGLFLGEGLLEIKKERGGGLIYMMENATLRSFLIYSISGSRFSSIVKKERSDQSSLTDRCFE